MQKKDKPNQQTTTEISDLFALKRCEKPDEAFWDKFQNELHQKTLQSLVTREAWYLKLWRLSAANIKPMVPLTAAATFIAALLISNGTLTSVSHYFEAAPANTQTASSSELPLPAEPLQIVEEPLLAFSSIESATDKNFVVGTFITAQEESSQYTQVAVAKSMTNAKARNVHYIAGDFRHDLNANDNTYFVY